MQFPESFMALREVHTGDFLCDFYGDFNSDLKSKVQTTDDFRRDFTAIILTF